MSATSAPARAETTTPAEVRLLRALALVGTVAAVALWLIEQRAGVLTATDRVMYPLLALLFAACSAWLHWRPDRPLWPKVIGVTALTVHLVGSVHAALFVGSGGVDLFKLSTATSWMPLCYSAVFVFFALRAALMASAAIFAALIGPIVVAYAVGAGRSWGTNVPTLLTNLALAQAIYVLMLVAVARLRSDFASASEHARVMQALAVTDMLTGLPNRRALSDALAGHIALVQRGEMALSVILIDVDHFKRVNDHHGHAAGDAVLVQLGKVLQSQLRASDRVGRWGGEEFLVIAPATTLSAGNEVAERLRGCVAEWPFDHGQPVTISLGVTQVLPGDSIESLLRRADGALYRAKQRGRNRVEHQAVAIAS